MAKKRTVVDPVLSAAMKRIMRHLKGVDGKDTDSYIKQWTGMNDNLYDRAVKQLIKERKVARPKSGHKIGTLMTRTVANRATKTSRKRSIAARKSSKYQKFLQAASFEDLQDAYLKRLREEQR